MCSILSSRAITGHLGGTPSVQLRFEDDFADRVVSLLQQGAVTQSTTNQPEKLGQSYHVASQQQQENTSSLMLLNKATQSSDLRKSSMLTEKSRTRRHYYCRPGCTCNCHLKREFRPPWLKNLLLGGLTISWSYQKSVVRCCCSGHTEISVTYQFPQYLLQRYISMVLLMTSPAGPELLLRVPRVLPWEHLSWRYFVSGDLAAIQRMYADRIASPHDVDPCGRNALFHAAKHQNGKVVKFLLEQGTSTDQLDGFGVTPTEHLLYTFSVRRQFRRPRSRNYSPSSSRG